MRVDRRRPVPRARVGLGLLIALAAVAGIITTANLLRHPLPSDPRPEAPLDDPDSDPRDVVDCGQAQPREGQERDADQEEEAGPRTQLTWEVTSNQLYDCPQVYDGLRVRYRGEVVGAVLRRENGAWVQLNDDLYAGIVGPLPAHRDYRGGNAGVGVLIPHRLADQVEWVGGPQTRGDVLEVTGVFNRVDPGTAEVTVIRADSGTIAQPGAAFPDPPLTDRRIVAVIVAAAALGLTLTERVLSRRR